MKSATKSTFLKYESLIAQGCSQDNIIKELKRDDYPITEAIKIVRHIYSISLGEAKVLVTQNRMWINEVDAAKDIQSDAEEVFHS